MPFRDLIGQREARAFLQGALRGGRIAHAYLFIGPAGVGRRATAVAFAQTLLCTAAGDDACGHCAACQKVAAGTHPDLRVVAPGGRTESGAERRALGIEQIRDLRREAAYPPYEARWKVFLVEDADAMRTEAANSLLKVLEEPPTQSVIILIAESAAALLPTIVSRAQTVRFTPTAAAEIARALTERMGVPADQARFLAALSGGRAGAAMQIATAGDAPFTFRRGVVDMLAAIARGGAVTRLDAAEAVARQRDDVERWLDTALLWLRDVAVWQTVQDPALLVNLDAHDEITVWARRAVPHGLLRAVEAIEAAKADLRRNLNPRLVLEHLFVGIALARPELQGGRTPGPGPS
jgi:DNA polymerase-3 subunit delta'